MGIVTQVENKGDGDPVLKMIGIITLEDIIEELIDKQDIDDDIFVDR
jgi:hypothetical protein